MEDERLAVRAQLADMISDEDQRRLALAQFDAQSQPRFVGSTGDSRLDQRILELLAAQREARGATTQ